MASRLNSVRLQRQRALARRRPNRWLKEPCPNADREVLEFADWRMQEHDRMSPKWRALVHHYGFQPVYEMWNGGDGDIGSSWFALEQRKLNRQADLLAANYFPKVSRSRQTPP